MADVQASGATSENGGFQYPDSGMLFETDFSDPPGLHGFSPLYDSGMCRPPLSLVCFPAFSGSHAMQLTTGAVSSAAKDGACAGLIRLTSIVDANRTYGWDCWFSAGGSDTTSVPRDILFGFDVQSADGTQRWTPNWRYALYDAAGVAINKVTVKNNAGTYVNATDRITGATLSAPYIYNQNKLNLIYMGGRWSTAGFQSATLWDTTIDLTGQSFGSSSTSTAVAFNRGFNWITQITNRTDGGHAFPAWAVIGKVRVWME